MTLVGEDELQSSSEPHVHKRCAVVLWLQENQNCDKVLYGKWLIVSHTLTSAKRMSIRVTRDDFSSWPMARWFRLMSPFKQNGEGKPETAEFSHSQGV